MAVWGLARCGKRALRYCPWRFRCAQSHSESSRLHDPDSLTTSTTSGFVAMSTFEPVIVRTPLLHEHDSLRSGTRCRHGAAILQIPSEATYRQDHTS